MIKAKGIYKSYNQLKVLKGIDLNVESGEIISIVGASGAGKSTLLHILGTLDQPDAGEIEMAGINLRGLHSNKLSKFRNEHIGFVFQFHNLLPEFTALENVFIPALIAKKDKKLSEKRAMGLLERLGLTDRMKHLPSEMSGGEQQRAAIARALMNEPTVVFADEPSGNLDSKNSKELHKLFFELRKELNQTFIIVTHNEDLANMADRKLEMKDGMML